ncbi:LEA type 2 family protein [Parasediminibacterium paludis]|uniref:LEA type 2 family protein n=1 Tax=Parasediminibacterium paludis TaxID=908966 RepID=A0ABV8Q2S6_9BACT
MKKYAFYSPLLLILLCIACAKPKAFEYRALKNVQLQQANLDNTNLTFQLVYFNPNKFAVDLKRIDGEVYINNNYLGKVVLDTAMHISKLSEFTIASTISVNTIRVLKNSLSSFLGNETLIKVTGTTRVGRAGFYITVPFNYEAKHQLKLF